jgi:glutamate synthase (NADPH/NADH)
MVASRIFRTDYGHTEVAAHFGNGIPPTSNVCAADLTTPVHCRPARVLYLHEGICCRCTGEASGCQYWCIFLFLARLRDTNYIIVRVEWSKDSGGRWKMEEVPGSEKFFEAQLLLLALGFLGPEAKLVKDLDLKQDARSNIQTPAKVCHGLVKPTNHLTL